MCLSVAGSQASAPQKTIESTELLFRCRLVRPKGTTTVLDGAGISYEKRQFWGNGNTWAYSDLPVVDSINVIHKAAAAMWPLVTTFIATCYATAVRGHYATPRSVRLSYGAAALGAQLP